MEENFSEETQLISIEEISPEKMSLLQRQHADQLYHQLGLDPVIDKVLEDFAESLKGMDKVTDRVFGPYDIKGRAEAVAKVSALITYAALSERHNQEKDQMQDAIVSLEGERDKVRDTYDNLVEKVADVVGGDYDDLKTNYNEVVNKLSEINYLKTQLTTLNDERAQLVEKVTDIVGGD